MKGITIKLPESTLRRLQQQAREAGRSVAALAITICDTGPLVAYRYEARGVGKKG